MTKYRKVQCNKMLMVVDTDNEYLWYSLCGIKFCGLLFIGSHAAPWLEKCSTQKDPINPIGRYGPMLVSFNMCAIT
jgi:hypothetical protein